MTKEEFFAELQGHDIHPNETTRSAVAKLGLYGIVGPSGSGKTTIIEKLGLRRVVGVTDRMRRPGEQEGIDYFFEHDYDRLAEQIKSGRFLQGVFAYMSTFYGTTLASYPKESIGVMAIQAEVLPTFQQLGFGTFLHSFLVPKDTKEWFRRWSGRDGITPEPARLSEALTSFKIALSDPDFIFIMNDTVGQAVEDIKAHISGEYPKQKSDIARQAAEKILQDLIKQ